MSTEPPTNVSTPPTTSNPSVPQPAKSYAKRQKYYYAMRALENEGIDDIFSEDADEVSGYLLSELISLRQERAGGNTIVLNYNEISNSKEKIFVRVSITNDTKMILLTKMRNGSTGLLLSVVRRQQSTRVRRGW